MGELLQFDLKTKEVGQETIKQDNARSVAPIVDLRLVTRRDLKVALQQDQTGTKNTPAEFGSLLTNGKHTVLPNILNRSLNAIRF